jgi:hypothetical protein
MDEMATIVSCGALTMMAAVGIARRQRRYQLADWMVAALTAAY